MKYESEQPKQRRGAMDRGRSHEGPLTSPETEALGSKVNARVNAWAYASQDEINAGASKALGFA